MRELPQGWTRASLGDIADEPEQHVPGANDSFAYIDIGAIDRTRKVIQNAQQMLGKDAPSRARKRVAAGDTLVSMTRPNLNAVALVPDTLDGQIASTGFDVLRPRKGVDPRWLAYTVRTEQFVKAMSDLVQGALYPAVRSKDVRGYIALLAPEAEQTRIADQLDTLLARIQACNDRLDAIPALLNRFRQAVINAATSGALTEEWRASNSSGHAESELRAALALREKSEKKPPSAPDLRHWREPTLPDNWAVASVHQFAECLDRLRVPIKKDAREAKEGLYPYYGANGEVGRIDKYIFDGELVLVTEDETFYGRVKPIAYRSSGKCWVNNHAHVLRAPTKAANDYLCFSLMHYNVVPWLTGTSGRAKLTQQALNSLPIAMPPAAEIVEIVRRVDSLFKVVDRIRATHATAVKQGRRLAQLTLAKAFRGELVEQDSQDEPASVSLQRLTKTPITAVTTLRGRHRHKEMNPSAALPAGAWAGSAQPDEHTTTALLIAVLKAWRQPMPHDQARLAAVLCLQPRLFTAALPAHDAASWRRLVGTEAEPLPASIAPLLPAVNTQWHRALVGLRARGDLLDSSSGPQSTWALGPGADRVDTTGWPDGRAGWVVAYLRAHGIEAVLPVLSSAAVDFVHARAA